MESLLKITRRHNIIPEDCPSHPFLRAAAKRCVLALMAWCMPVLMTSVVVHAQLTHVVPDLPSRIHDDAFARYEDGLYGDAYVRLLESMPYGGLTFDDASFEYTSYKRAVTALYAGHDDLAQREADALLKASNSSGRSHPFAHYVKAVIAFSKGDHVRAAAEFDACDVRDEHASEGDTALTSLRSAAGIWRARSLLLAGNAPAALTAYTNISRDTSSMYRDDALYAAGQIYEVRAENDSALAAFMKLINEIPGSSLAAAANIRAAQCLVHRREFSNALTRLAAADDICDHLSRPSDTKTSSNVPDRTAPSVRECRDMIGYLRGECLHASGLYEGALKEFSRLQESPGVVASIRDRATFAAGTSLLALNEPDKARAMFDSVIARDTSGEESELTSWAFVYKAIALRELKRTSEAQAVLQACTENPRFLFPARAFLEMAEMRYEAEDYDSAFALLKRALRNNGDVHTVIRSHILTGSILINEEQWTQARESYDNAEIAMRRSTESPVLRKEQYEDEIQLKRGIANHKGGQDRDALNDLSKYLSRHPADARADEALFWLAESFFHAQLMKNAADSYRKLLVNFGSSNRREESLYGLGWVLFRTRELDSANITFSRLLNEYPATRFAGDVNVRRGDALYLTKKYGDASKAYAAAVTSGGEGELFEYARFQVGQSCYRAKEYAKAVQELTSFLNTYPSSSFADHALYTVAYIYSLQERHSDALREFDRLVRSYPQSELVPASMYYAANSQYSKGDYEDAMSRYRSLMGLYPTTYYGIEALRGLQESLSLLGRDSEAIDAGKSYVAANPQGEIQEQISMKTIEIFLRKGDYAGAAKEYQDFLKKYPDSEYGAEALFLLAKSQSGLNDFDGARSTLTLLCSKYEHSEFTPQAMMQLALLEIKRSNVMRADTILTNIIKTYPGTELAAHAMYEQGVVSMGRGDTARALFLFVKSGELQAGEYSHQSLYRMAMHYRSLAKDDSARVLFRRIAGITDNSSLAAECVYRIGESYLSFRDYAQAQRAFEEVKNTFDGVEDWYTLSLIGLGECYEKSNNPAKARETYQTVIILHPEDDFGTTAQSRLKRLRKD